MRRSTNSRNSGRSTVAVRVLPCGRAALRAVLELLPWGALLVGRQRVQPLEASGLVVVLLVLLTGQVLLRRQLPGLEQLPVADPPVQHGGAERRHAAGPLQCLSQTAQPQPQACNVLCSRQFDLRPFCGMCQVKRLAETVLDLM